MRDNKPGIFVTALEKLGIHANRKSPYTKINRDVVTSADLPSKPLSDALLSLTLHELNGTTGADVKNHLDLYLKTYHNSQVKPKIAITQHKNETFTVSGPEKEIANFFYNFAYNSTGKTGALFSEESSKAWDPIKELILRYAAQKAETTPQKSYGS